MMDVVEAPVLLLDRKLKTELRLLEMALCRCSGDVCMALYACGVSSTPWVDQDSEVEAVDVRPETERSIDDCRERGSASLL
jgi:hypothetical protein